METGFSNSISADMLSLRGLSASPELSANVALQRQTLREQGGSFASVLQRAGRSGATADVAASDEDPAREAAEQYVATALVQPFLKQLNDSVFKSDLFHGGFAEDAFQQQLSQIIADRLVKASDFSLVDTIYDRVMNAANQTPAAGKVDVNG